MSNVLQKAIVLCLNANWERIGYVSPKKAIIALTGGLETPPALALHITTDENGELVEGVAVPWEEWIKLPVRECDIAISTSKGDIRCPMVIVEPHFAKMPMKRPKLSNQAILERDGYIDQYTGEKLNPKDANVDHVIARDAWKKKGLKGSPNNWTNMVCCHKDRNFKKSNKTAGSFGMVLQKRPKEPKEVPISFLVREAKHPHHLPFIPK